MTVIECKSGDFRRLTEDVLERGATLRFRARGRSMRPLIRDGDLLTIIPFAPIDARVGDVILFRQGERLLVHRVISRQSADRVTLVAKGDAHLRPDPPISSDRVLGKVIRVERDERRIDLVGGLGQRLRQILWGHPPFLGCRIHRVIERARQATLQI